MALIIVKAKPRVVAVRSKKIVAVKKKGIVVVKRAFTHSEIAYLMDELKAEMDKVRELLFQSSIYCKDFMHWKNIIWCKFSCEHKCKFFISMRWICRYHKCEGLKKCLSKKKWCGVALGQKELAQSLMEKWKRWRLLKEKTTRVLTPLMRKL